MDASTMTFEEILFHGRYHIIGAVLFLIFFGVFIQEAVKEFMAVRQQRRSPVRGIAFGPLHDGMLGQTMTDGGEPVEDEDAPDRAAE